MPARGAIQSTTSRSSSSTSAAAHHSPRSASTPSARIAAVSSPCSVARIPNSRSSVRKVRRRRTSGLNSSGQRGPVPSSRWPSITSASRASCSPPVRRVGRSSRCPFADAVTASNASEVAVRASGPCVGTPSLRASTSRRLVAVVRLAVRTRIDSGAYPRSWTRSATSSIAVVVLPVPGAPRTAALRPSGRASTARCDESGSILDPGAVAVDLAAGSSSAGSEVAGAVTRTR
ncbi:hypothetical protein ACH61_02634 [Rathayibacter tanaceti]|uniref:Uncharacterized protein n=1 Tax=Rathayibacter tanaceti TaxID=1671680 RepID=A0A166HAQ4_9MICO|nr:hypothetical protein ACH61_02634 [Rathayibacter tanaceti]